MSRIKMNLNRDWKFKRGDIPFPGYKGIDDRDWDTVSLPHDWSVKEPFSKEYSSGTGYLAYGTGWYRRSFSLPEEQRGRKIFITFEGVYNNSQVWCNSCYINRRPSGYSSFTYDITEFVRFGRDDNVVSVKVDHKHSADSRWFTGSGIYRNVYLTITDKIYFEEYGVFVSTKKSNESQAVLAVTAAFMNETGKDENIGVEAALVDRRGSVVSKYSGKSSFLPAQTISGEPGQSKIQFTLDVEDPLLWSPDNPVLYDLVVTLAGESRMSDRVTVKTGIRSFRFDPREGFFLNGRSMKMKGVCLHHDAGCLGAAVPKSVWKRRLEELKQMGCNAIRCSHNPPAPDFLDLCDEIGFLVQDEAFDEWEGAKNKWWQGHNVYPPRHHGYYEDYPEWHERDIQGMVKRDRNHPSIVFWSIGNEIDYPNDPYCHPSFAEMTGNNDKDKPAAERMYDPDKPNAERLVPIAKELVSLVKECDRTRPVTAALAFPELSNLTGLADALDIVGYNYKEKFYEQDCRRYPDRVIYGSENGKHLEAWNKVRDNKNICAQFLWTGIDFLGESQGWPVRISCAGLMNTAGYRKASFYYRQSLWAREPMVQLVTVPQEMKDIYDGDCFHWNYNEGQEIAVRGYSNCHEVELFLNDSSLGKQNPFENPGMYAEWKVPYFNGTLKAVARTEKGEELSSVLVTRKKPSGLDASIAKGSSGDDGIFVHEVDIRLIDSGKGQVCHEDRLIYVDVAEPAELLGLENGMKDDLTPYSSPSRLTYRGQLKAYVRTDWQEGKMKMTIKSEGMDDLVICR